MRSMDETEGLTGVNPQKCAFGGRRVRSSYICERITVLQNGRAINWNTGLLLLQLQIRPSILTLSFISNWSLLCLFTLSCPSPFIVFLRNRRCLIHGCLVVFLWKKKQRLVLYINPWGATTLYAVIGRQTSMPIATPGVTGPPQASVWVDQTLLSYVHGFMSHFPF